MRYLIALFVLVALSIVGLIAHRELHPRGGGAAAGKVGASATREAVATIAVGERVDVNAHVPRQGLTVVAFTADF